MPEVVELANFAAYFVTKRFKVSTENELDVKEEKPDEREHSATPHTLAP